MLRFFLGCLLFFVLTPAVSADQDYVHPQTKLKFPSQVGSLARGDIQDFGREGGLVVSYVSVGQTQIKATLYVYDKQEPIEPHMKNVELALLSNWQSHKLLEKKRVKTGKRKGLRRRYRLQGQGMTLFSEARLYVIGPYFVKLRLTGDFRDRAQTEKAGVQLMSKILSPGI